VSAPPAFARERWAAVAAALDVEAVETVVCRACLASVALPLDRGDVSRAHREARVLGPDLWHEGLREPLLSTLRAAADAGVPDAREALRDLEARGARSAVVAAVVLRLAEDEARRPGTRREVVAPSRLRLPLAPPGSN
jgi:hypothetical protein